MGRKRASLAPPKPVEAQQGRDYSERKLALWKDALYENIARRLLNHHPLLSIATAVGYGIKEIRNILQRPDFAVVYERVKGELYGTIDEALRDQRRSIVERNEALMPVSFSELVKIIQTGHGSGGTRPSERARLEAILYSLGLGGHVPVEKRMSMEVPIPNLQPEQVDALTKAFAAAMQKGDIIDVTPAADDVTTDSANIPDSGYAGGTPAQRQ